jgi:hypothetical protein
VDEREGATRLICGVAAMDDVVEDLEEKLGEVGRRQVVVCHEEEKEDPGSGARSLLRRTRLQQMKPGKATDSGRDRRDGSSE